MKIPVCTACSSFVWWWQQRPRVAAAVSLGTVGTPSGLWLRLNTARVALDLREVEVLYSAYCLTHFYIKPTISVTLSNCSKVKHNRKLFVPNSLVHTILNSHTSPKQGSNHRNSRTDGWLGQKPCEWTQETWRRSVRRPPTRWSVSGWRRTGLFGPWGRPMFSSGRLLM